MKRLLIIVSIGAFLLTNCPCKMKAQSDSLTSSKLDSRPSKRRHRIFHIALREELVLKI